MIRGFLISLLLLISAIPASASEEIVHYDVDISVLRGGDIIVSETIDVRVEGFQIKRGIFRSLPRYYTAPEGDRLKYDYKILSITRDGRKEAWQQTSDGNATIIRIGHEDRFLETGRRHVYAIRYRVRNQIRYFDNHDELYWNVTGNYWDFPISAVTAKVEFPAGARFQFTNGFTGALGVSGSDYEIQRTDNGYRFETTRPLGSQEGLTLSIGVNKGLIDPPSAADKRAIFWQRYAGIGLLIASVLGVFYYYFRSWQRVGRDAPRLPVFPQYHPPKGLSPAAAHYIFYRTHKGNDAFAGTLVDLAVKGYLKLNTSSSKVTLTRQTPENPVPLTGVQTKLLNGLFGSSKQKTLGGSYDTGFSSAYSTFKSGIQKKYGNDYFRWNTAYAVIAVILSLVMVFASAALIVNWTIWHTGLILLLILINLAFFYFLPAQTLKGEKARSAIAGFRLYLETAEKLVMNTADVTGERPPPMSKARYEALLPYAIALNVEEPWSKYFEKALPDEARDYNPGWGAGNFGAHSLHSVTRSMTSAISSGVSTASVQPSSSSGSSGGGFSGGGGGGGGGGGW